jgi:hypothetical protein
MSVPIRKAIVFGTAAVAIAAGLVAIGHVTAGAGAARDRGYRAGHSDGYFDGLRVGEAQGRQEGRALQEGSSLPAAAQASVRGAFDSGYTAGDNDAFAGYDGGWQLATPYLVTLEQGSGSIAYRISTRTQLRANVDYHLCANGHSLCQRPKH